MSGGLDSCVSAAIARERYELWGLHANYGQRTEKRELEMFNAQVNFFGVVDRLVVDLSYFEAIGGSSLTDSTLEVPNQNLNRRSIPNTYVPFRNAHLLSIATSWAEVIGAERIFIGAVWEDSSGYPDCRPQFYDAMNALLEVGTRPSTRIKVDTPLIALRKSEIIQKGSLLGAPFDLTWSCYRLERSACGTCDSCALRLRAFAEADLTDPIAYETRPEYAKA